MNQFLSLSKSIFSENSSWDTSGDFGVGQGWGRFPTVSVKDFKLKFISPEILGPAGQQSVKKAKVAMPMEVLCNSEERIVECWQAVK